MSEYKAYNATDFAAFFSFGGGVLYLIGWNYWKVYYGYFGIDQSWIDLPFHQVIASSWVTLFFFLYLILYIIFSPRKRVKSVEDLETNLLNVGLFLTAVIALITIPLDINFWIKVAILLGFVVASFLVDAFFRIDKIEIGKKLKDFHGKLFFCLLLLTVTLFLSTLVANNHAKTRAMAQVSYLINIEVKNESEILKNYVFIAYMSGKYFITEKTDGIEKPTTIIIDESEITKAEFVSQ